MICRRRTSSVFFDRFSFPVTTDRYFLPWGNTSFETWTLRWKSPSPLSHTYGNGKDCVYSWNLLPLRRGNAKHCKWKSAASLISEWGSKSDRGIHNQRSRSSNTCSQGCWEVATVAVNRYAIVYYHNPSASFPGLFQRRGDRRKSDANETDNPCSPVNIQVPLACVSMVSDTRVHPHPVTLNTWLITICFD